MTTILLNPDNPLSRDEATAVVYLIEAMEAHLNLTGAPSLNPTEKAGLTKLRSLAGIDLDPSYA